MDADLAASPLARVDELVRRAGRSHEELAGAGVDGLVAHGEGRHALVHDEDLLVGVAMEAGPLAGSVAAEEERDACAVPAALELAGALAPGEVIEFDRLGHAAQVRPPRRSAQPQLQPVPALVRAL